MLLKMQRTRKKTTQWNIIFQYIQIFLTMISGIVLVPLYLKFISLNIYGAWLATGNVLAWIAAIDPGLSSVLQQKIGKAYGEKNMGYIGELISSGIAINLLIFLFLIIVGIIVSNYLFQWLNFSEQIQQSNLLSAFLLAVIGSAFLIFSFSFGAINRGLQGSAAIGFINTVVYIGSIILTITLLYKGYGVLTLGIGHVFRGLILCLCHIGYLSWRVISERIKIPVSLTKVRSLSKLISYTFVSKIAAVFSSNLDLFFISKFLGPESVAVLNMTRQASNVSKGFVFRPTVAFAPAVSHLIGANEEDKARMVLLRLFRIIFWFLGLLTAGFIVFNQSFVTLWVGAKLYAGSAINIYICIGFFVTIVVNSFGNICFALGNIRGNSIATFIQSILSILFLYLGVKYFDMAGAILAPVIAMMLITFWYFPISFFKILKLDKNEIFQFLQEILIILVVSVPVSLLFLQGQADSWLGFAARAIPFCLLYLTGLFLLSKKFKAEILGILAKFRVKLSFSKANQGLL